MSSRGAGGTPFLGTPFPELKLEVRGAAAPKYKRTTTTTTTNNNNNDDNNNYYDDDGVDTDDDDDDDDDDNNNNDNHHSIHINIDNHNRIRQSPAGQRKGGDGL